MFHILIYSLKINQQLDQTNEWNVRILNYQPMQVHPKAFPGMETQVAISTFTEGGNGQEFTIDTTAFLLH